MVAKSLSALVLLVSVLSLLGLAANAAHTNQAHNMSSIIQNKHMHGDVVVVQRNGHVIVYDAKNNTDLARGQALLSAFSKLRSGDTVYLAAENYSIATGPFNVTYLSEAGAGGMLTGVKLLGAGKYKTRIYDTYLNYTLSYLALPPLVMTGCNSVTANLSLVSYDEPYSLWGTSDGYGGCLGNATLSNVYLQSDSFSRFGIYVNYTPSAEIVGNIIVRNATINATGAAAYIKASPSLNAYFYNTNASASYLYGMPSTGILASPFSTGGNIYLIDTTVSISNGYPGGVAVYDGGSASTYLYGSSALCGRCAGQLSLWNAGNMIAVNSTSVYNSLRSVGVITNIGPAKFKG
ncbi:MAG: hypothetical protein KGH94_02815 [Candidatus Micrarchaeota archaeon]|nr:hypothetical protein [Candidatus Micrarchaeota archaeon]